MAVTSTDIPWFVKFHNISHGITKYWALEKFVAINMDKIVQYFVAHYVLSALKSHF